MIGIRSGSSFETSRPLTSGMYQLSAAQVRGHSQRSLTSGIYSFECVEVAPSLLHSRVYATQRLNAKLESFGQLASGWDGYEGQAAKTRAISDAKTFIERLPQQSSLPRPSLAGSGEITLYWDSGFHYLEASFPGDGTYHYFCDEGSDPVDAEDDLRVDSAPTSRLRRILMRFFA
jgi:hypothetical protein